MDPQHPELPGSGDPNIGVRTVNHNQRTVDEIFRTVDDFVTRRSCPHLAGIQ